MSTVLYMNSLWLPNMNGLLPISSVFNAIASTLATAWRLVSASLICLLRYCQRKEEIAECTSVLHDLIDHLNYEPGHLNFEDYAEFCKEALRMSGLAPKQEEMRQLFAMIDADESGTLERHEILHAVMGDWDVQRLLKNSKTLQPLAAV